MGKLGYLFSRVRNMHYRQMLEKAAIVRERTGRNRLAILIDMAWCGWRYQAGYMDYLVFEMYNLTGAKRATYVTRGENNRLVGRLNRRESWVLVEDKARFNTIFAEFMHRQWCDLRSCGLAELAQLVEQCDRLVVKPLDLTCGKGIEFIDTDGIENVEALYNRLKEEGKVLVEAFIHQHSGIAKLYPKSVNTIRLVTIVDDQSRVHIVFSSMRLGNGKMVDNLNSGGMATIIDLDTGIISKPGADKDGKEYAVHPHTGVQFVGTPIPFFQESVDMVKQAALKIPELRYLAWDVAVTEEGPLLIEANHFPGHDIYQFQCHLDDGIGLLPRFKAALGEI